MLGYQRQRESLCECVIALLCVDESQSCKAAVGSVWESCQKWPVLSAGCSFHMLSFPAKFILVLLWYCNLMFLFDPPPLGCDFVVVFGLLCISFGLMGVVLLHL